MVKANTRAYESFNAKLGILSQIDAYGKSLSYIDDEQQTLMNMSLDDFKEMIDTYMVEENMIYLVVGDKATQFEEVKKLGKKVVELDIFGNEI